MTPRRLHYLVDPGRPLTDDRTAIIVVEFLPGGGYEPVLAIAQRAAWN